MDVLQNYTTWVPLPPSGNSLLSVEAPDLRRARQQSFPVLLLANSPEGLPGKMCLCS